MPSWLPLPGWLDLVDITLVAGFVWLAIRSLRRARARAALVGLALLGVVYLAARSLELRLSVSLLQAFFAVLVLVLVVVFQEDLRRVFEQLGTWRRGTSQAAGESETRDLLVRTVARLAATSTGALFVVPGQDPLDRHVEGGIALGGRISEPLLLSLFDASSPGHDGAVLVRGSTVERFALHLPLSANHAELGAGGTRHAAALGLSERCDALCIVVSEERGTVAVARDGEIRTLSRPEDLVVELGPMFRDSSETRFRDRKRIGLDAAIAGLGALVLWMVLIPGSDLGEVSVLARVDVTNLPQDLDLESIDPSAVDVTLRGLRRDLLLAERDEVSVQLDAYLARLGRRTFTISELNVRKPDALSVVSLTPERVRLSVKPASPAQLPSNP